MARIYKQRDKWCFSIESKDDFGKRHRIVRGGFLSKKEAMRSARLFENDKEAGRVPISGSNVSLHDFMWSQWFEYHKNFTKISTQVITKGAMRRIDKYFPLHTKLKDVTTAQITQFINHLFYEQKLSKATIITTLSCLKMAFKYAVVVEKLLAANPTEYVFLPKQYSSEKECMVLKEEQKRLYLEKEEIRAFMTAARQARNAFPMAALYMMLIYTGMRIGEVLSLQWKNIDFEKRIIHVRSTIYFKQNHEYYIYSPKTKASIRDIVISANLLKELKQYRKCFLEYRIRNQLFWQADEHDFVFVSSREPGKPLRYNTVVSAMKRLGKEIGFDGLHPHLFRHTHVSILAEAQVPLSAIKERLGHTNDKTTEQIYLHITKKFKAEAAEKFDAVMNSF